MSSEKMAEETKEAIDVNQRFTASDSNDDKVSYISMFNELRIPFSTSVYDEDSKLVVRVRNRDFPVGSAHIPFRNIFVTSDEYAVLESGEASSSTWHMGFLINPDTRRTLQEYPDITCPVTITLNGDAVPYYRNFPFQECSILTPFGIYVTSTEFEYIQHITDQRRVSALEDQAVVHKHELALARIDAEKNGDITNSNLFDDDDDDASEIVKEKKLPVKQCQHIQSPFSLASFTKWWKWFHRWDKVGLVVQAILSN